MINGSLEIIIIIATYTAAYLAFFLTRILVNRHMGLSATHNKYTDQKTHRTYDISIISLLQTTYWS